MTTSSRLLDILQSDLPPGGMFLSLFKDTMQRNHKAPHSDLSRVATLTGITNGVMQAASARNVDANALIQTGFASEVLAVAVDGHLCGFSKEELTCWSPNPNDYLEAFRPYITATITLLTVCLKVCSAIWDGSLAKASLEQRLAIASLIGPIYSLLDTSMKFWNALWEIRSPFLDSQPGPLEPTHIPASSLELALVDLAKVCWFLEQRIRSSAPTTIGVDSCPIAHVMLASWIWGSVESWRTVALEQVVLIVEDRCQSSPHGLGYTAVFEAEIRSAGCTGPFNIAKALLRDFKSDFRGEDRMLHGSLWALTLLRPNDASPMTPRVHVERALFAGALAAARSQACVASSSSNLSLETMMEFLCFFVTSPANRPHLEFSEQLVHAVIAFLSQYMDLVMGSRNPSAHTPRFSPICKAIEQCADNLRGRWTKSGGHYSSRKLNVLRRRSCTLWRVIESKLRSTPIRTQPGWVHVSNACISLGNVLRTGSPGFGHEPPTSIFGPLERCAWAKCLCSVHKPAHRLRVCSGCWCAAYCCSKCQASDWPSHKEHCRVGGEGRR